MGNAGGKTMSATTLTSDGHHHWSAPTKSDWFIHLHANLLYSVIDYLAGDTVVRLCHVSTRWRSLELKQRARLWQRIVRHEYGNLQLLDAASNGMGIEAKDSVNTDINEWRSLYIRLYRHQTDWSGYALDQWTASFQPYPMIWLCRNYHQGVGIPSRVSNRVVKSMTRSDDYCDKRPPRSFYGRCHWPSLRDSMTRCRVVVTWPSILTLQDKSSTSTPSASYQVHRIWFEEEEVVRGEDILVPNHYQVIIVGSGGVGCYTGGEGGVFWLALDNVPRQPSFQLATGSVFRGLCAFFNQKFRGQHAGAGEQIIEPSFITVALNKFEDEKWLGEARFWDGSYVRVSLAKQSITSSDEVKATMIITEFIDAGTAATMTSVTNTSSAGVDSPPAPSLSSLFASSTPACFASRLRAGLTHRDAHGRLMDHAAFYLTMRGDSLFGMIKSGDLVCSCYLQLIVKPDACNITLDDE